MSHDATMVPHKRKMRRRKKRAKTSEPSFHPPILFCGECSACAAPPPPIMNASFEMTDRASHEQGFKSIHLRVYHADVFKSENSGEEEKRDFVETILLELNGVTNVTISDTNPGLPHRPGNFESEEAVAKPGDSNSFVVKVDYDSGETDSESAASITDNPQEPKEEGDDQICQSILTRLSDAGFDCVRLPNPSTNSLMQNDSHTSTSQPMADQGPTSCRTRLRVQGICCMSEVPAVRSILKPLQGVRKLGINVATKVVFIDHDPSIISALALADALNNEQFGAEVLSDGDAELMKISSAGNVGSSPDDVHDILSQTPRSRFVESTFFIPGMMTYTVDDMESCPIGTLLRQNFFKNHLRAFHLHATSRTLKIEHDPKLLSAEKVMDVLVQGLKDDWGKIELAHDGAVEGLFLPVLGSVSQDAEDDTLVDGERKRCAGLKANVIISGVCWVLSLMSLLGGSWGYLEYAGIGSVVFGLPPALMKACATLRRMHFDANCMMVTAALGALVLGEFDEAASVSFLFAVSEWLETRATRKGRRALGEIISLRPDYANVVDPTTGDIVIVPAVNIPVGTVVSVRTGDKVPADAKVVEGTSSVDESSLTGEARPVEKRPSDDVSGGSINVGSQLLVCQTTSTVSDSTLSRLIRLVEEAQANTSETEVLIDAFARKYTPIVLAIALLICTVPWCFGEEAGRYWMLNGLIFIVIACPCALTISTPVTYSAGLAAAAQRGIIIKGGSKLEALGNAKTVLFDKTGTLTTGKFTLNHLFPVGDNFKSRKELLELLAIMEAPSSHPLSACLVAAAKDEGVVVPAHLSLTEHTILNGEGVSANVNDEKVFVGNKRLFERLGMYKISSLHMQSASEWSEEGGTVGYIGTEELGIVGMFCVKDTIREEARDVISSLLDSGVRVVMLTGDGQGAAQAVGKEIGLEQENIHSQLLPEDKLHFVSELKGSPADKRASSLWGKKNLTLMVGDGVNDAPALSVVDLGVAMGEGASLAMEMSDVTLMDSNLSKLLFSLKLGAKVIRTVKENIILSLAVNLVAVILTFFGKMTLLWAIASDVGVMLLVTLNGMKLLSKRTINSVEGTETGRPASKRKDGQRYEQTADIEEALI